MPDFNPDKERHVDHSFIVLDAEQSHNPGVMTSRGYLRFNDQGRMRVRDAGLAREIQSQYPAEVSVTRIRNPHPSDRGHIYFFAIHKALPWHKYDKFGQRIREEETTDKVEEKQDGGRHS